MSAWRRSRVLFDDLRSIPDRRYTPAELAAMAALVGLMIVCAIWR